MPLIGNRGEGLGVDNWRQIANAVADHSSLRNLVEFKWSPMVLAPVVDTINLDGLMTRRTEDYSVQIGAVVLGALLPRHINTLKTLNLRCVVAKHHDMLLRNELILVFQNLSWPGVKARGIGGRSMECGNYVRNAEKKVVMEAVHRWGG
jgi:hypothetical protein